MDVEKFFTEFPYTPYSITMSDDGSRLFYTRNGETSDLMMLELGSSSDLDEGTRICDEDFSKKNLWDIGYNETDKYLYWTGDEKTTRLLIFTVLILLPEKNQTYRCAVYLWLEFR